MNLPKFIWQQIGMASACPSSLTLPWKPLFDRLFFRILNLHLFIENNFSEVRFKFLYHFRVHLLISITFWSILAISKGSGKI